VEEWAIDKVIMEHKDRLSRFMVSFLQDYFAAFDVEIEWMSERIGSRGIRKKW
jgi:predicted site-specific integrase-resolvase